MITSSALMVGLFFGGYLVPGWDWLNTSETAGAMIARVCVTCAKVFLFICVYMLVRWTLPRFRFDQLMRLAWKSLVPLTMALVAVQVVIVYLGCSPWWALFANAVLLIIGGVAGLASGKPITGRQHSLLRGRGAVFAAR
jgi:NADH-quinone oxidoreductase subunit H